MDMSKADCRRVLDRCLRTCPDPDEHPEVLVQFAGIHAWFDRNKDDTDLYTLYTKVEKTLRAFPYAVRWTAIVLEHIDSFPTNGIIAATTTLYELNNSIRPPNVLLAKVGAHLREHFAKCIRNDIRSQDDFGLKVELCIAVNDKDDDPLELWDVTNKFLMKLTSEAGLAGCDLAPENLLCRYPKTMSGIELFCVQHHKASVEMLEMEDHCIVDTAIAVAKAAVADPPDNILFIAEAWVLSILRNISDPELYDQEDEEEVELVIDSFSRWMLDQMDDLPSPVSLKKGPDIVFEPTFRMLARARAGGNEASWKHIATVCRVLDVPLTDADLEHETKGGHPFAARLAFNQPLAPPATSWHSRFVRACETGDISILRGTKMDRLTKTALMCEDGSHCLHHETGTPLDARCLWKLGDKVAASVLTAHLARFHEHVGDGYPFRETLATSAEEGNEIARRALVLFNVTNGLTPPPRTWMGTWIDELVRVKFFRGKYGSVKDRYSMLFRMSKLVRSCTPDSVVLIMMLRNTIAMMTDRLWDEGAPDDDGHQCAMLSSRATGGILSSLFITPSSSTLARTVGTRTNLRTLLRPIIQDDSYDFDEIVGWFYPESSGFDMKERAACDIFTQAVSMRACDSIDWNLMSNVNMKKVNLTPADITWLKKMIMRSKFFSTIVWKLCRLPGLGVACGFTEECDECALCCESVACTACTASDACQEMICYPCRAKLHQRCPFCTQHYSLTKESPPASLVGRLLAMGRRKRGASEADRGERVRQRTEA